MAASMITSILNGALGLLGSAEAVGIFVLLAFGAFMVIYRTSYTQSWLVILPLISALTAEYLPLWVLLVVLVPFGWTIAEILVRKWQGSNYS